MSDDRSKRVTREDVAAALEGYWAARGPMDPDMQRRNREAADAIFDALPATPAASGLGRAFGAAQAYIDTVATPAASAEADAAWEGHDRGHLQAGQVGAFLRSVIASGERLSFADVDDIEAALSRSTPTPPVSESERLARGAWQAGLDMAERANAIPTPTPDATDAGSREALLASDPETAERLHRATDNAGLACDGDHSKGWGNCQLIAARLAEVPAEDVDELMRQLAIVGDEHADLAGRAYLRIRGLRDALAAPSTPTTEGLDALDRMERTLPQYVDMDGLHWWPCKSVRDILAARLGERP